MGVHLLSQIAWTYFSWSLTLDKPWLLLTNGFYFVSYFLVLNSFYKVLVYESILYLGLLEAIYVKQNGYVWGSGLDVLENTSGFQSIKLCDPVA